MSSRTKFILAGVIASCVVTSAEADRFIVDVQGTSPDRIVTVSSDFSSMSTPVGDMMFGPIGYQTLEVTMVYEGRDQPYWTKMELEFKCPNPNHKDNMPKKRKGATQTASLLPETDMVEFRMKQGETRAKSNVNATPLQPTEWQSADTYLMKRLYRVACGSDLIQSTKRASVSADGQSYDLAAIRKNYAAIGLNDAEYIPQGTFGDYMAEFVWDEMWKGATKPPIDNGPVDNRPITAEQRAETDRKLAELQAQLNQQRDYVMGKALQMKAENDFIGTAAKYRNNRKWSKTEQMMAQVWLTRTEAEVVAAIGRPVVTDAGGVRFLGYGQEYDARYIVRRVASGQEWVEGVYQTCDLEFALIPDSSNVLRVADVVVKARSNAGGNTLAICRGLLDVPNQ